MQNGENQIIGSPKVMEEYTRQLQNEKMHNEGIEDEGDTSEEKQRSVPEK